MNIIPTPKTSHGPVGKRLRTRGKMATQELEGEISSGRTQRHPPKASRHPIDDVLTLDEESNNSEDVQDHNFLTTSSEAWQIPDSDLSIVHPKCSHLAHQRKRRAVKSVDQLREDTDINMKFLKSCKSRIQLRSLFSM